MVRIIDSNSPNSAYTGRQIDTCFLDVVGNSVTITTMRGEVFTLECAIKHRKGLPYGEPFIVKQVNGVYVLRADMEGRGPTNTRYAERFSIAGSTIQEGKALELSVEVDGKTVVERHTVRSFVKKGRTAA